MKILVLPFLLFALVSSSFAQKQAPMSLRLNDYKFSDSIGKLPSLDSLKLWPEKKKSGIYFNKPSESNALVYQMPILNPKGNFHMKVYRPDDGDIRYNTPKMRPSGVK